ncbi:MAG: helix-turn-helix domain-containing protein, partial [Elusimicrobia bacterium]|nr:helix-turn-helix domain-containing protein [Elusimicrobiota bacterium]
IGAVLRAARLKRGQTLDTVAQQTRISKRFLEALENDRFEQFPAIVYLRGFLKGYCEHLEVDFEQIWAKLEAAQAPTAPPEEGAKNASASPAHPAPAHSAPAPAAHPAHAHPAHPAPSAPAAPAHSQGGSGATGAIVLAVALALGLFYWLFKDKNHQAAPVSVAPMALQPLPRAIEPKLVVHLKNDAWLRVTVDGQMTFEGRAPRGAAQEWKPLKFVALRTTEPAAIELELNGAAIPLGPPTADGEYRIDIP